MSTQMFSIEAEQALLGALMYDPTAADRIDAPVTATSFCREDHRRIYAAIERLRGEGKPHDSLSVADALGEYLEPCGGLAYVVELQASVMSLAGVKRHAEIVAERATRRAAAAAANEIAEAAADPQRTAREVVDLAQSKAMALGEQSAERFNPMLLADALRRAVGRLQARLDGETTPGLSTGFPDLDARLGGGMRPGQLIVVAARPGMGKTSLAMQIGLSAALSGAGALFCSQEMAEEELSDRALALHGRLSLERIISGKLDDEDWTRTTAAMGQMREAPLWIDEQPSLSLMDVRNKARRVLREHGSLSLIVVDYLQLMVGPGSNRNAEIEAISRGLKQLAKELCLPVVALSQLSRECEKRPNKRPMASDLRDSGAIEQDADVILTLYRDEIYNPDSSFKGMAELGVIKCRSGRAGGFVPLVFRGECTRFDSMAHGEWPQPEPKPAGKQRRGFDDF